jgi:hypothetical protein
MNYENNIYYYPEKSGLEIVGVVEVGGDYEFDTFVVWKNQDNNIYWSTDSGCSCPTPFEDHDLEDIVLLTEDNFKEFSEQLRTHIEYSYDKSLGTYEWHPNNLDLFRKVNELFYANA